MRSERCDDESKAELLPSTRPLAVMASRFTSAAAYTNGITVRITSSKTSAQILAVLPQGSRSISKVLAVSGTPGSGNTAGSGTPGSGNTAGSDTPGSNNPYGNGDVNNTNTSGVFGQGTIPLLDYPGPLFPTNTSMGAFAVPAPTTNEPPWIVSQDVGEGESLDFSKAKVQGGVGVICIQYGPYRACANARKGLNGAEFANTITTKLMNIKLNDVASLPDNMSPQTLTAFITGSKGTLQTEVGDITTAIQKLKGDLVSACAKATDPSTIAECNRRTLAVNDMELYHGKILQQLATL